MLDIQSVSDWANNAELIRDVAALGYLPDPVLDLTHNEGKFWTLYRPASLVTNDLDVTFDTDHHEDFRATKFGDGEFASVVFDPPYKLSGTNQLGEFDRQYGTSETRSRKAITALFAGGIAEAARIASEFVLVKCMDQISSGALRKQTAAVFDIARVMELTQVGEFWIEGSGIPQDPTRGQQHERHTRSTLMVFGTPGANNRRKKSLAPTPTNRREA